MSRGSTNLAIVFIRDNNAQHAYRIPEDQRHVDLTAVDPTWERLNIGDLDLDVINEADMQEAGLVINSRYLIPHRAQQAPAPGEDGRYAAALSVNLVFQAEQQDGQTAPSPAEVQEAVREATEQMLVRLRDDAQLSGRIETLLDHRLQLQQDVTEVRTSAPALP